jgi:hypothetical protein
VASGHAGVVPLLTGNKSRLGRGVSEGVYGEWISQAPEISGYDGRHLMPRGGIDGGTVSGMVRTVIGFRRPSRDG